MKKQKSKTLVDLSTKTFLEVVALLTALMLVSIALTYLIPKGSFGLLPDGSTDYLSYHRAEGASGTSQNLVKKESEEVGLKLSMKKN